MTVAKALYLIGVVQGDTFEEAQHQYRLLCKEYHPDCGGDAQEMATFNEAWAVLRENKHLFPIKNRTANDEFNALYDKYGPWADEFKSGLEHLEAQLV